MLVRKEEALLENRDLAAKTAVLYTELVTVFWFQGTFHLCQDKLMSLIPTSFIKAFHIIGNGQAEIFLVGKKRQLLNSIQTGEDTEPNPGRTKVFSDLHQKTAKAETLFQ